MQRQSWLSASLVLLLSAAWVRPACAEAPTTVARAEALFQSGRQLMREGRYAEACPKLAESQQLDPAPGTQLNLADCWEHAGLTASAQREFMAVAESAEKTGEKERAAIARGRVQQLENKLTRLALMVPAEARLPGFELLRNSVIVPTAEWGRAQPVDPGHFVIEARAPGRRTYRSEFALKGDAATHNLTIPVLVAEGAATSDPASAPASRGQWLQRSGIGLAGLGVVGLTIGTVFGVRAIGLYHRSQDEGCNADDVCTPGALETRRSAVHNGNVSTVSLIVGGALLASGAGLYVWGTRERGAERARLSARITPHTDGAFATFSSHF